MGTRGLTIVESKDGQILHLMKQSDGYPDSHGRRLAEFLKDKQRTDGFRSRDRSNLFNGMECLAAQIVAHFKVTPGRFYLGSQSSIGNWGEPDYTYVVRLANDSQLMIEVKSFGESIFNGSPGELIEFEEPDLEG